MVTIGICNNRTEELQYLEVCMFSTEFSLVLPEKSDFIILLKNVQKSAAFFLLPATIMFFKIICFFLILDNGSVST